MRLSPRLPRVVLWLAVLALLLKAAVPALAAWSAHAQGKPMAEICSVYGVVKVALDSPTSPVPAHPSEAHGGDACALTALLSLPAPGASMPLALPQAAPVQVGTAQRPRACAPDAAASWLARRHHGPPASA